RISRRTGSAARIIGVKRAVARIIGSFLSRFADGERNPGPLESLVGCSTTPVHCSLVKFQIKKIVPLAKCHFPTLRLLPADRSWGTRRSLAIGCAEARRKPWPLVF